MPSFGVLNNIARNVTNENLVGSDAVNDAALGLANSLLQFGGNIQAPNLIKQLATLMVGSMDQIRNFRTTSIDEIDSEIQALLWSMDRTATTMEALAQYESLEASQIEQAVELLENNRGGIVRAIEAIDSSQQIDSKKEAVQENRTLPVDNQQREQLEQRLVAPLARVINRPRPLNNFISRILDYQEE